MTKGQGHNEQKCEQPKTQQSKKNIQPSHHTTMPTDQKVVKTTKKRKKGRKKGKKTDTAPGQNKTKQHVRKRVTVTFPN